MSIWQRLIEPKPDDCYAHASLGWALGGIGKYREAISELEKVLTMDPTFQAHYAIGLYHFYLKEYREAIDAEEKAILQKRDADAYCVIAASLLGQGEPEQAIAACKQALDLDHESHLAWHNMGEAYLETSHLEEAISCLDKGRRNCTEHFRKSSAVGHCPRRGEHAQSSESMPASPDD